MSLTAQLKFLQSTDTFNYFLAKVTSYLATQQVLKFLLSFPATSGGKMLWGQFNPFFAFK